MRINDLNLCFTKKFQMLKLQLTIIHPIAIFILINILFIRIQSQCPEACLICSNSTSCTSCISQNNIILINGTMGCLPCPAKCQKCTSQNSTKQCTTCSTGYYRDPSSSIQVICKKCKVSNCKKCNQYFASECQQCQNQYFLQQSTSQCKSCKNQYVRSKTCRQNFIFTCQQGYFTSNGQFCSLCSLNNTCKTCTSLSLCSQCYDGYFLINSKCQNCDPSCKTCNSNSTCTTCPKGYRLNSVSKCQICSAVNCTSCTINDICQQCSDGFYLDNSNKKCVALESSKYVQNCLKYANNFNFTITSVLATTSILCRTCITGTYSSLQTNSCQYCSLLCESCTGSYRSSKCLACKSQYSRLIDSVNGICSPKIYSQTNQKVIYLNNRNNVDKYIKQGKKIKVVQNLYKCPGGQLSQQVSIKVEQSSGYWYKIYARILLSTTSLPPYNVSVYINNIQIISHLISNQIINSSAFNTSNSSSLPNSYTQITTCNQIKIFNLSFNFNLKAWNQTNFINSGNQPNIFKFNTTSTQTVLIDVRQIVILVKQCHQTCALCLNYQTCTKCNDLNMLIQQQKCVSTCTNGFFLNYLAKTCLTECPTGMYQNIRAAQWTCELCNTECQTCIDKSSCLSCNEGYYLFQNSCVDYCPIKYFKNQLFNKCQKCIYPCQQCTSIKQCLTCMIGFHYMANKTCLNDCPQLYYGNLTSMSCQPCKSPCRTCKTSTTCSSCTPQSKLSYSNGQCVKSCPTNYFSKSDQQDLLSCQFCYFPCLECEQNAKKCTACIQGFLLDKDNSCIQVCPINYYNSITFMKCLPCKYPCKSCWKEQNICLSCEQGYSINYDDYTCLQDCTIRYYRTTVLPLECKKCKQQCLSCVSAQQCSSCEQEYYLQNKSCILQCWEGYYKSITLNNQKVCLKCQFNCKTCFGQSGYCLSCNKNFFLKQNNTCSSTCLSTQLFPGCQQCQYPCYSCQLQKNQCTLCQNNFYLSNITKQCVSQCYIGYYKTFTSGYGYCVPCQYPCTNCANQHFCYSCSNSNNITNVLTGNLKSTVGGIKYYLRTLSSTEQTCSVNCSAYEYKNDILMQCLQCVSPCLTCNSLNYCTSCQNGVLINGSCFSRIDGCPIGTYQINSTTLIENINITVSSCTKCPSKCSSCKSSTICTACMIDYFLHQSKCIDFCPSGTTHLKQLRKCIYCEYPCIQCQNYSSYCTKCGQISLLNNSSPFVVCPQNRKNGNFCIKYYIYNGQCLQSCSSVTYPFRDKCLPCVIPCATCLNQIKCTSCVNNTYMLQTKCYEQCPLQYYKSIQSQQCSKCLYPCRVCLNLSYCLQCQQGYLYQNQCLTKQTCPAGYLQNQNSTLGKYCQKCDFKCLTCSQDKYFCLQCKQIQFSVYQGLCLQSCYDGFYSGSVLSASFTNISTLHCIRCPQQCLTCQSQTNCTNCVFSYFLLEDKCVVRCPPDYMERQVEYYFNNQSNSIVTVICSKCLFPCSRCSIEQQKCESCISGYYMYQKKCLQICPNGTYLNSLSNLCKQCVFPCKYCKQKVAGQITCLQCFSGYLVSQDGICVQKCLQNQVIDFSYKKCLSNCSQGFMTEQIDTRFKFCSKQCSLPYLKDNQNKKCVTSCAQQQYINSNYECQQKSEFNIRLLQFVPSIKHHIYVNNRGILSLYLQFSRPVIYKDFSLLQASINITYHKYLQEIRGMSVELANLKSSAMQTVFKVGNSDNISSSLLNYKSYDIPFKIVQTSQILIIIQLYPPVSISSPSSVQYLLEQNFNLNIIDKTSKIPLQTGKYSIELNQNKQIYQRYDYKLVKNNKFSYIGQIIMDFVLIVGLAIILFNKYSKIYNLMVFTQSIFMLACLNMALPPNLNNFLRGFKFAHFYQFPNLIVPTKKQKLVSFQNDNFNRIQSVFQDANFFKISGHLICIFIMILIIYLVMHLLKYISKNYKFNYQYVTFILQKSNQKLKNFKWSYLTDIYISTFMLVLASFFFQTLDYSSSKTQQPIAIVFSYLLLIGFLSYTIYFLYKNYRITNMFQKEPQKFVKKKYLYKENYLPFFQGISAPLSSYKNYLLVIKIAVYGVLTGILWDYPNFCIAVWIILQLCYAGIFIFKKPFSDEYQNYLYAACGIIYGISMILVATLNQYNINSSTISKFVSEQDKAKEQKQMLDKKWLLGYLVIILILVCVFIQIIQMFVSIMRGNLKRKKLEGQQEQYNQVRNNSPNMLLQIQNKSPKKIVFQQKRQFEGYSVQNLDTFYAGNKSKLTKKD